MSLKPVLNEQNRVELLILEGHDITERIRAEEALQETFNQFQQSQKMEAIGRLAGGIAHDFNNLLTSILGFSNMALEQLTPEEEVYGDLQEVVQAANRAQNLTQKLLALSRKDVPGFTMDKLKEHGADESEQLLIRKPYSREILARRIRSALDTTIG